MKGIEWMINVSYLKNIVRGDFSPDFCHLYLTWIIISVIEQIEWIERMKRINKLNEWMIVLSKLMNWNDLIEQIEWIEWMMLNRLNGIVWMN